MLSTPVEDALMQAHAKIVLALWEAVRLGLIYGFAQRLFGVAKPAVNQAKTQFLRVSG